MLSTTPGIYVGEIRTFAAPKLPDSWLLCDGKEYSVTDDHGMYKNLFAVIGTYWGSRSLNHFNVPDLRGMFLRGWNDGRGSQGDPEALLRSLPAGAPSDPVVQGNQVGSSQADLLSSHGHTLTAPTKWGDKWAPPYGFGGDDGDLGNTTLSTSSFGGSETRPKNVAVLYGIKY